MKKEEFLKELERLLCGISEEERVDAVAFYRSYFEDAGEENEASILAELESPQKVAESILKDLGAESGHMDTENTKAAWNTGNAAEKGGAWNTGNAADTGGAWNTGNSAAAGSAWNAEYNAAQNGMPPKKDTTGMKVLFVIFAVLSSPVWLIMLAVIAVLLFSLLCTLLALAVSAAAVMAALLIAGVVLAVFGIALMPTGNLAAGMGLLGGGCVVFALGVLAVLFVVFVCGVFLPWAVKGIFRLCRKPFDKRRERAA